MKMALSARLRRALELEKCGLTQAEAGKLLGISEQGFAMRLARARRALGRKRKRHTPPVYVRPVSLSVFRDG